MPNRERGILLSMPRFILSALLIWCISAAPYTPAPANGDVLRARIDAAIATRLSNYQAWQENYRAVNGRYFQALITHRATPADGALVTPDNLSARPTDQAQNTAQLWAANFPNKTDFSLKIDAYNGPAGPGHVVDVYIQINGATWQRAINSGPETWRDQPWAMVRASSTVSP